MDKVALRLIMISQLMFNLIHINKYYWPLQPHVSRQTTIQLQNNRFKKLFYSKQLLSEVLPEYCWQCLIEGFFVFTLFFSINGS